MSLAKILKKTGVVAGLSISLLSGIEKAAAETHYIDRTWTPQELKNLVDGNNETFGKGGTNAQNGDVIHFLESFRLSFERTPHVTVAVPNLTFEGENTYDTVISGGIDNVDGGIFVFSAPQSTGFLVRNLTMDNALFGALVKGGQEGTRMHGIFENVYFNLPQPVVVDNFPDRDANLGGNIRIDGCTMQSPEIGVHESQRYGRMNTQTRSFFLRGCTLLDVVYLGVDAPAVCPEGGQNCECPEKETLEWGSYDNNVFTGEKGGSSFVETFYCSNNNGRPGPLQQDTPDYNVEYGVQETLAGNNRGTGNLETEPLINYYGLPRINSPLIENGEITRGASKNIFMDTDGNKKLDLKDYANMQNRWQHDNGNLKKSVVVVYDYNGDGKISYGDYKVFAEDMTGPR